MFYLTAPLANVNTEYRGASNFTVTTVRLNLNTPGSRNQDRFLDLKANGADGDRIATLLGDAPEGAYVRIAARPTFRTYNDNVYSDLEIVDVVIQGSFGSVDSSFTIQGFIGELEERTGSRDNFFLGKVNLIAYSRDGLVEDASIEMIVPSELVTAWRSAQGKMSLVSGTLSGHLHVSDRTGTDRAYARYVAGSLSGTMEVPTWLREHAGEPTVAVTEAPAVPF